MSTTLEQWKQAGLVEVGLPSGFRVRIRPISPTQVVIRELLSTELLGALVEAREGGAAPSSEVIGKVTMGMLEKKDELVARAIRDIWNGEAWEPITVPAAALRDGTFPGDDVDAIYAAADPDDAAPAEKEGVDVGELVTFPEVGPRPVDGEDGGAVRPATVRPRGARRSPAGARVRPGHDVPPGAG